MKLFRICQRRPVFFSEEETALNWNILILWRCFRLIFIKQTYIKIPVQAFFIEMELEEQLMKTPSAEKASQDRDGSSNERMLR